MNKLQIFDPVRRYLTETVWKRKIFDVICIVVLLLAWGIANGTIPLPTVKPHTVENTLKQSADTQRVLTGEQYTNNYRFIGSYKFHNGTVSVDGYNFMKYSLTEYAVGKNVTIDPILHQNIPIVMNNAMINTLSTNKCFTGIPDPNSNRYEMFSEMKVHSYTACPIFKKKLLSGFILVGAYHGTPPSHEVVNGIINKIYDGDNT